MRCGRERFERFVAAFLAFAASCALMLIAPPLADAGIATTPHNLSVSGPGTRKATGESEICVFCHAPHNASPSGQLWNRRLPTSSYTPYTSSTLKGSPGQPNGASLLCLSCHDGTIALGEVLSRAATIPMTGGTLSGDTLLGTSLSDDHPVSFRFDAALRAARGELVDPSTLVKPSKVRLDTSGQLQCTTCHDAHDNTNSNFLVVANAASALCQTCHLKNYWSNSKHKHSPKTWNGMGADPWPHTTATTVAANACENCHRPHTAGGGPRLLNHAAEEGNCLACHNGNVAAKNVQAEFSKAYAHDIGVHTGIHTPSEPDSVATSHVECVDCHNPHAVNATLGSTPAVTTNPAIPGSLAGVRGIHIGGSPVNPATAEYEICFRCHADGAGNTPAPRTARQIVQDNTRLEFQTSNPSYHPLAGAGRSTNVPSLLAPWSTSSRVKCTDCHNNNIGPYSSGTGTTPTGSGVNGAHGSTYPLLLERQYVTADYTTESATNYALCYKCHSRTSILSNATFREHSEHIVGARTPCNVCHDPHGISNTQGTATNNARLINFDTSIVQPFGGVLRWTQTATNSGTCTLICHGKNHNNWTY